MTRRALRVLHTSDVHLTPFDHRRAEDAAPVGGAISEEDAFVRLVDRVLEERADLFLIAGDLFDSNRVDEPEILFVEAQLSRLSCPVVVIPGNHDCCEDGSIYRRFDFGDLGDHVHALTAAEGELLTLDHLDVTLWGKGLVEHVPANRPLAGVPARVGGNWFIGLAHGLVVPDAGELRSSLILPDEIAASALDYLALGHVHVFRDVSHGATRAFYPGSPLVPYAPERSSVALVTLDPENGIDVECLRMFPGIGSSVGSKLLPDTESKLA